MAKYFSEDEVRGLDGDLVGMLDAARESFGMPIRISSGYRDPASNTAAGGVKDSAHEKGLAVDIAEVEGPNQKRLIWALTMAGFRRMGAYDKHVHVDTDLTKPNPAFWTGLSH